MVVGVSDILLRKMTGTNVDQLSTLKTPKCGPDIDPTTYIYIYIWRTPHFMGRYGAFWAFPAQFYSKNAHNLQPLKGGCKVVFLFSSFSLLSPFSALFFLFSLCFYKSQSLKIAHQLRCAAVYLYIYICE